MHCLCADRSACSAKARLGNPIPRIECASIPTPHRECSLDHRTLVPVNIPVFVTRPTKIFRCESASASFGGRAGFVVDDGAIERRFSIRSFHGSKAGLPDREDHRPLVPPNSRTVAYQVASVHGTTTTYVQKRGNNTRTVQKQHSLFYEERIICQPPFFLQFEGEAGGLQTVLCTYRTGILDRR